MGVEDKDGVRVEASRDDLCDAENLGDEDEYDLAENSEYARIFRSLIHFGPSVDTPGPCSSRAWKRSRQQVAQQTADGYVLLP